MSMDVYQLIDMLYTYMNTSVAFRGTEAQKMEMVMSCISWRDFYFLCRWCLEWLKGFFTKQIIEEEVNAVLLFLFPASVRILELEASLLEAISCFVYKEYFECGSSLFLSGFFN